MSLRAHPRLPAAVVLFVLVALVAPALSQAPRGKKHALLIASASTGGRRCFPA